MLHCIEFNSFLVNFSYNGNKISHLILLLGHLEESLLIEITETRETITNNSFHWGGAKLLTQLRYT